MDTLYLYALLLLGMMLSGTGVTVDGKCTYRREFRMWAADCDGQNYNQVPTNLRPDTEILYLNMNRIRGLTNLSFSKTTNLHFIYMRDNFVREIERNTFSELEDLEVLDLTTNGLLSFSTALPLTLRKLYLANNPDLRNVSLTSAYNLAYLSLAECKLQQVPTLGLLPNLKELNLTANPLVNVTPADLAPLCRLEKLHLPPLLYNTVKTVEAQCNCHRLLTWASLHYIKLPGFNCTGLADPETADCEVDLSAELQTRRSCLQATPPVTKARYMLMGALATVIAAVLLVLLCWWRKSRRKHNAVQSREQPRSTEKCKAADTLIM